VDLFVDAELGDLLQAVHHVRTLHENEQHIRVRGAARLDEIGGEIAGAERREFVARHRAAELREISRTRLLQRVAEGIVGRDEMPLSCRIC